MKMYMHKKYVQHLIKSEVCVQSWALCFIKLYSIKKMLMGNMVMVLFVAMMALPILF